MNVIKYLRKHLEKAMARTGAPNGSGKPSWEMATEGKVGVGAWPEDAAWPDEPPERVWEFRVYCRRMPLLIGRGR